MLRGTHIPFSLRRWQTKPAQISWRNSERDTLTILIIWTDIRTTKKVIIQLSLSLRSENTNEGPVPSSPSCSLAQSRAWLGMLPIFIFVLLCNCIPSFCSSFLLSGGELICTFFTVDSVNNDKLETRWEAGSSNLKVVPEFLPRWMRRWPRI